MKKKNKNFIENNLHHLKNTVDILNEGVQEHDWNKRDLIAMGACLADIYNGYESIFRTLLEDKGIKIPGGEKWHKDLLDMAKSENLVPDEISITLNGMLSFRHRQIHGYSYMLKEEDLRHFSVEAVKSHYVFEKHVQEILKERTAESNTENNPQKANLQSEAIQNRLQAQAAQEIISKARAIPQGMDGNLPNVDLNGTQENVLASVAVAETEVKKLQSDAASKDAAAVRSSKIEAISAAKSIMGKDTIVTSAANGIKYQGDIIAKTDTYAIQRITNNQAVLHEIKNISDEANLDVGAQVTLHKHNDKSVLEKDSSQEQELDYGRERGEI